LGKLVRRRTATPLSLGFHEPLALSLCPVGFCVEIGLIEVDFLQADIAFKPEAEISRAQICTARTAGDDIGGSGVPAVRTYL